MKLLFTGLLFVLISTNLSAASNKPAHGHNYKYKFYSTQEKTYYKIIISYDRFFHAAVQRITCEKGNETKMQSPRSYVQNHLIEKSEELPEGSMSLTLKSTYSIYVYDLNTNRIYLKGDSACPSEGQKIYFEAISANLVDRKDR